MVNQDRLNYESIAGRVSDSTWRVVRRNFEEMELSMSPKNIRYYAKVRAMLPSTGCSVAKGMRILKHLMRSWSNLKVGYYGHEIIEVLSKEGINPSSSTLTRWFKDLGGWRANKQYEKKDLLKLVPRIVVYASNSQQKIKGE